VPIPPHKIDNFKKTPADPRGVGVEVEWNNKTEFYDRDLNNFRLLRNLGVLSVGVMITRLSELQALFDTLGKGKSYGNSTTHWDKLIPKVDGGGAGGCPLLLIGMGLASYDPNS
jgi:restriction endonuclease BglII